MCSLCNGLLCSQSKDSALFLFKKIPHNSQTQTTCALYPIKQVSTFINSSLPFLIPYINENTIKTSSILQIILTSIKLWKFKQHNSKVKSFISEDDPTLKKKNPGINVSTCIILQKWTLFHFEQNCLFHRFHTFSELTTSFLLFHEALYKWTLPGPLITKITNKMHDFPIFRPGIFNMTSRIWITQPFGGWDGRIVWTQES